MIRDGPRQARVTVVRISVPPRIALVTGVVATTGMIATLGVDLRLPLAVL